MLFSLGQQSYHTEAESAGAGEYTDRVLDMALNNLMVKLKLKKAELPLIAICTWSTQGRGGSS